MAGYEWRVSLESQTGFVLDTDLLDTGVLGFLNTPLTDSRVKIRSVSVQGGTNRELDKIPPSTATIVFDNRDGLFNPDNTSSPYYGQIFPGKTISLEYVNKVSGASFNDALNLFYGVVTDWSFGYDVSGDATATVSAKDLLGLLAGLDTPSEGSVKLGGVDIFALDEDGRAALRKQQLGFVFQSFQLLGHLNALENVMLPLELRGDREARRKAEQMLDRVGLGARLKHYPRYLSGGEQQRVALARAFVTEPPLLLADEPTGSLDAATGAAVIELMFALNRERGSTLVLVTHDPSIAARCAQSVTIAAGRVVEQR